MNFSEFSKQNFNNAKENINEKNLNSKEDITKLYNEMKNMNSDELTRKLFDEVAREKQEGSFNYAYLESSVETLKPYLSQESYENIKRILKQIK